MSASVPLPASATYPDRLPVSLRVGVAGADWRPRWCRDGGLDVWLGINLCIALSYLGLGWAVGRFFASFGLFPAPIWLPSGVAAVAAMMGGWRVLPGVFIGSFLINAAVFESDLALSGLISLGNALGPWAGITLTRRFRPVTGLFTRFRGVAAFLAGAVLLHASLSALCGTLSLWLVAQVPAEALPGIWSRWLLCDAGGTFFFAPSLALWLGVERVPTGTGHPRLVPLDMTVWLGTALLALLVFMVKLPPAMPAAQLVFLLAVPLSWIALRISLRAAYTLLTLICIIASAGTVAGFGPFQSGTVANPMQSVGLLIVLCAMNILTLLALVSERREAEMALAEANQFLERRVTERTAELRRLAETDGLTGLANRRCFMAAAEAALRRDGARGRPFALIAFDLDHFKSINDTAGHAAGDAVLRLTAERCAATLRHGDLFGRIGGEEFAIALPSTTRPEARRMAEQLRAALSSIVLPLAAGRGRVSGSFGIAMAEEGEDGLEGMLRRADAALYTAKRAGRDQVQEAV